MGADRKGPLAAFIVIAIIAAILLITSVRSHAATGWLGRTLPSTPEVVNRIGGGLDQVVEHGAVLVQRTVDPAASSSHPAAVQPTPPARGRSAPTRHTGAPPSHSVRQPAGHHVTTSSGPGRHRRPSAAAHGHPALARHAHARHAHARPDHTLHDHTPHDHGRHLGWCRDH